MTSKQTIKNLVLLICLMSTNVECRVLGYAGATSQEFASIGKQKCCAHSVTLSRSQARSGKYSYKLEVNGSDPGVYPHHRAEIYLKNNMSQSGSEYWYGWSTYIPTTWIDDPKWVLISQWHTKSDLIKPNVMQPLQLQLNNDRWCWKNWIGRKPSVKRKILWCETFSDKKGQWIDWVVNVRWTSEKNGFFRIWRNGEKVVDVIQPTIFPGYPPYWKVGLVYPSNNVTSHSIFVDELRIGDSTSSYDEVAPK